MVSECLKAATQLQITPRSELHLCMKTARWVNVSSTLCIPCTLLENRTTYSLLRYVSLFSPCWFKLAFHGADTDADTDSPNSLTSDTRYLLARILARKSARMSVSHSTTPTRTFSPTSRGSSRECRFLPLDAMLSAVCRRRVSVRLSVCVSVTFRYCIKTAKRIITQIMPHGRVFKWDVL